MARRRGQRDEEFPKGLPPTERSKDGHQAGENGASLTTGGRSGFEVKEVEDSETLERASTRDRIVASLVARSRTARAFGDIERDAEAGAVELIGKLGAFEGEPTDNVGAKS